MADRFERIYTLPERIYAEGAPVIIEAGALLKDNKEGTVIAQLKIRNIQQMEIKAVRIKLTPFDIAGRSLGESVSFQYLDLIVERDQQFGEQTPVTLPDASTRSFTVSVIKVVYLDNTIWANKTAVWATLPQPEPLDQRIEDIEMRKQFHIRFGNDSNFYPSEARDLWYCTCGVINHWEEALCHKCAKNRDELLSVDLLVLKQERDARLAEEAHQKAIDETKRAEEIQEKEEQRAKAEAEEKTRRKKRNTKNAIIVGSLCAVVAVLAVTIPALQDNSGYRKVNALSEAGQYEDSKENHLALIQPLIYEHNNMCPISADQEHTVGVRSDGTVVAAGNNSAGGCNVGSWNDIVAVSAGFLYTVELRSDGTVVATGFNDVDSWRDIVAVSAGSEHAVGLRSDGTVVAADFLGSNFEACDVGSWKDIVAVSAGMAHTVGLHSDGTVVAIGFNKQGQCNVGNWNDIVAVSAGLYHTVGLCSDGTVVATGFNDYGQCDVGSWKDIVAVSAGWRHTVGLRSDGTVVAAGNNEDGQCDVGSWKDIVEICAGNSHTVGLRSDGTVVAVGDNEDGQCKVGRWKDIRLPGA